MRNLIFACALVETLGTSAARIEFSQDHADALYRIGEEASIVVTVRDEGGGLVRSGEAKWSLDNFGAVKLGSGTADLSGENPFVVKGTMNEEGFLRLSVTFLTNSAIWSVGYDVDKIRQDEPCPADFDAYWAGEKSRLVREVPLDPKVVRDATLSKADYDVFRVSFATFGGKRVYGFLTVPTDKSHAPFRVGVCVPGAGPGVIGPVGANAEGMTLTMNVHCFEPAMTASEQKRLMQEQNRALAKKFALPTKEAYYPVVGLTESREDYWYHDVLLGINRAVDWVCEREDVDLGQVVYSGTSQGGGFGLMLGALNSHFTKTFVSVCAITGHYGFRQKRQDGWPRLISGQPKAKRAVAERYAAYFDGVNFASRIHHPIRFLVGFSDQTCAPPAVYAAYNVCPSTDKAIVNAIGSKHDWWGWYEKRRGKDCMDFDAWLRTK